MNEEAKENNVEKKEEPPSEMELLAKEVLGLQEQLNACEEKYLRVLAESENARKRMLKEREESMQYAVERAFVEFLQPLDNFEKALKFAENSSPEVKSWALGFEMILSQFKQVLLSHGITEFESIGHLFDPHLHEAVEVIETSEVEKGKILAEFSRGYKKGDRMVRPAKVKVAKAPAEKKDEPEKELKKE